MVLAQDQAGSQSGLFIRAQSPARPFSPGWARADLCKQVHELGTTNELKLSQNGYAMTMITAKRNDYIIATANDKVKALAGSTVYATAQSMVIARKGSLVHAENLSTVIGKAGSTIYAHAGSVVTAEKGCTVYSEAHSHVVPIMMEITISPP